MTGALAGASAKGTDQLSVTATPSSVAGSYDSELSFGQTDTSVATPVGGLAPYTYSWAKVSGFTFNLVPSAVAASIAFNFSDASHHVAVYRLTVTDALGQTATYDVSVTAN